MDDDPGTIMLALGDSLSEGRGDPAPTGGWLGWTRRLASRANASVAVRVVNLCRRSAVVADVLADQLPRAATARPGLIALSVGVNDACGSFAPRRFGRSLDELLGVLASFEAPILVLTPPDLSVVVRTPDPALVTVLEQRIARAAAVVGETARSKDALVVDVWAMSRGWPATAWSDDNLHPGAMGHELISEAARKQLAASRHRWFRGVSEQDRDVQ